MSVEAFELLEGQAYKPPEYERLSQREKQTWVVRTSREPWLRAAETAKIMGLSTQSINTYWHNIRKKMQVQRIERGQPGGRAQDEVLPSGRVTPSQILPHVEQSILAITKETQDRKKIAQANLRDLAQAAGKLVEIRALLSGEPTQIVAHEQRSTLQEVGGWILEEIKRRGMDVRVDQRTNELRIERNVTPVEVEK